MATAKKPAAKSAAPRKKVQTNSASFLTAWKKDLRRRWQKNPSLYTFGVTISSIIVLLVLLFVSNKSLFLAGSIDGTFVTSPQFYSELTKSNGKEVFDSLVRETLIKQEAARKGVSASEKDVDKELKKLEDRLGGKENFEQAIKQNNTTLKDVRDQITLQILVNKILGNEIKVTDKEIADYKKNNQEFIGDMKDADIRETIKSQKLNEKFASWFEELKKKANISTFF